MSHLSVGFKVTLFLLTICLLVGMPAVVSAEENTNPTYSIRDLSITPATLMPGDTGTLMFTLVNAGPSPMIIDKVSIRDTQKNLQSKYDLGSLGSIGSNNTMTITVPIVAGEREGIFYPYISITLMEKKSLGLDSPAVSLRYPFNVVVDSSSLSLSINQRPDVFKSDTTEILGITLGNLRANKIDAVQLTVSGNGVSCEEGVVYVGSLDSGQMSSAFLTVTSSDETTEIILEAKYRNGGNWHTDYLKIPVTGGELRTGAELVINNVGITYSGSQVIVVGDVNNAGLTSAKGLVVTVEGATAVQPYPAYVVGSLDPDGLSEFEVTFNRPEVPSVTLCFTYKDEFGNTYMQKEFFPLDPLEESESPVSSPSGLSSGGNNTAATVIAVILIILFAVVVIRVWKNSDLLPKKRHR